MSQSSSKTSMVLSNIIILGKLNHSPLLTLVDEVRICFDTELCDSDPFYRENGLIRESGISEQ